MNKGYQSQELPHKISRLKEDIIEKEQLKLVLESIGRDKPQNFFLFLGDFGCLGTSGLGLRLDNNTLVLNSIQMSNIFLIFIKKAPQP